MIDALSTIPFDTFLGPFVSADLANNFKLFGILKLIRVTRLTRIIRGMRVDRTIKGYLKLLKLMFLLCMYVHCVGCAWHYFCLLEKNWIPPQFYIYDDHSKQMGFWSYDLFDRYWYCVYTSLQYLFCSDLFPQGSLMVAFGVVANVAGALVMSNLVGELAVLVGDL